MDKNTALELNRRLLKHLVNDSTDTAAQQTRLPADLFTRADYHARERQRLFLDTPQPVAFSAELAQPGSFLALDVLDVPVLLTRDDNGRLHAFINACAHRGAPVARDSGRQQSLVCPFHGWAYTLDGRLRGRPEEACFSTPKSECTLTSLPVAETCGVVVLGIGRAVSQEAVDSALQGVERELKNFQLQRYQPIGRRQIEVLANWKLVTDLSLESYHFKTLHRDSVAPVLAANAVVDSWGKHSRWAFPLQSIAALRDLDESEWPESLQGSCTYTLYPGVMFIFNALGAQMIRAEPGNSARESRVIYAGVRREDCDPEQALRAYEFGGDVFTGEDLPVAEACQRGLAASGRDLLLGRNEPLLQLWHRLWREALA